MFDLKDKVAVVTGAGRGIGQAIALAFAKAGARVAAVSRTEANAKSCADAIHALAPDTAKAYTLDVSKTEDCLACGKKIIEDFGKVDILVNNAGVTKDNLVLKMTEADWETVLNTNLKGAFNMVKALQRSITRQEAGRIINITSVIGLMGQAGQANYAASKAGLIGLTKSLAREFAGRATTVNAIAPGFITTDMTEVLKEEQKAAILEQIPLKSFGSVEDISNAVLFLAGHTGRYITGQTLTVDGGMVM
jgi:3-oxoacyl-[acyl-carrier protein] reductase